MNEPDDANGVEAQQTVQELDSIKSKLLLLIESLNSILALHPSTSWPPVLDQLNNIIARYESILRELQSPVFSQALVHPHMLIQEDPEFIPRILLRTKLIPEIDDEERNVISAYIGTGQTENKDNGGAFRDQQGILDPLDQTNILKRQREWESKVQQHEELMQAALEIFSELRQELDPMLKTRMRNSGPDTKLGKRHGAFTSLEHTLAWMSSGPLD
ncbi:hypothetical protein BATDEDRAFT_84563 [Batrachochytrium dendrobatidis JAM81]|uniref:Uncharacterized protein n=1 Tax=Batrachochytrium dendrobatidis (strain JAM81 / FGSC 10211) TaxID=684364 RepID=F4NSJ7_BATDJ|nr:uncharacterized protein BATDEDRAFT_84563 [Batrachochytrium dendrobatidis JAM81]EGF83033.1 hypothetical protein BATDEDRAFT_84563 [Batrachochytrium dendrobatidis JAM81]|eukprot:XP_006675957.1 hypothetical protein BATDEDRAFT_84563 [Batrachochytrium dendrobatidis JAM81]